MNQHKRKHRLCISTMCAAISAFSCFALLSVYLLQPDVLAVITFWPPWIWVPLGLLFAAPSFKLPRKHIFASVVCLWLIIVLALSEEPVSVIRSVVSTGHRQNGCIRILTLNCSGGSIDAANEVKRYHPDIVLLQESPGRTDIQQLARNLFGRNGGFACGPDASILARGKVNATSVSCDSRTLCTTARVILHGGFEINVVSLRLEPPVFRTDIWSPDCWRVQTASRKARRAQLESVLYDTKLYRSHVPVILGGDFNTPAGDAIYRLLQPRMHDAFRQAGKGWGNTVLNDFPVQRIDQVWLSDDLQAISVRAHKTRHSDHRLVVCDVMSAASNH